MARRRASLPSPRKGSSLLALKRPLDRFLQTAEPEKRIPHDPIEFPHRFENPRDIEVVGLLSASLAYGRADLFKPKLRGLLAGMGEHPSEFVRALDVKGARKLLDGFVYRFNVPADIAVLLLGMGKALREKGSLEALFLEGFVHGGGMHPALSHFTRSLRDVPMEPIRRTLGAERGLGHLLPCPLGPGAAKRLNLYLRWMVRGPDAVDFGIWTSVPSSALVIPLDTHIHRMALNLGLTRRKDMSWKTAEEVTAALRRIDAADPVRYDFALCHYGMSGICPSTPKSENCRTCLLLPSCRIGPGVLRRKRN